MEKHVSSHHDPPQRIPPSGRGADFAELWEVARDDLYALCLGLMGGSHTDAEEAFGNASVVALVKFAEIGSTLREPKAWLSRLFRNACMDLYRKRKRQRELGVANLEDLEGQEAWPTAAGLKTPQQSYLDRELDTFIRQSVRALPARLRGPMVLRFFRQLSYQEIGFQLRISEENARKRVQQARAVLRERLVSYFDGGPGFVREILEPDPPDRPHRADGPLAAAGEPATLAGVGPAGHGELGAKAISLRMVQVRLGAGFEKDFLLFLPEGERRRPETRLAGLERYAEKHPGGWKKRREVADVLYLLGRWDEALAEYRFVLEKQPFLLDAWLRAGTVLVGLRRDAEAAEAFQRSLLLARGASTRQHLRGAIDLSHRRRDAALCGFADAAALDPSDPVHWNAFGALQLELDRPLEALDAFDRALAIDPQDLRALTLGHRALLVTGRSREARRRATHALEIAPGNLMALKRMADLRCRRRLVTGKEGAQTRRLLRAAHRQAPEWPGVHDSLALYHLARGERETGEAILAAYLDRHPDHAHGWMLFARYLTRAGREPAAVDAVLRALALDRDDSEIHLQACRILTLARSPRVGAVREEMLERFPERWRSWSAAGMSLVYQQETGRACLAAEQAVHLQPRLAAAWLAYGTVLFLAGRLREAIAALETAWSLLPREDGLLHAPPIAYRSAESHRRLGDPGRALEAFRRAAAAATELADFDLAEALLWRGRALAGQGNPKGALREYRRALRHHLFEPARSEARQAIQELGGAAHGNDS